MPPPLSSKKPSASQKAASQFSAKESSVAKKAVSSSKLPTVLKAGSAHNAQPPSAKSVSLRPSASARQPSLSKRSSIQSKHISQSHKPSDSAATHKPSASAASQKPPASAARAASIKYSISRKMSTAKGASSVAKSDAGLKSASRTRSEAIRNYSTVAQKSASTKKLSLIVTTPVASAAKSGVASNTQKAVIVKEPVSSAKSGLVSKSQTEKQVTFRQKPSSSTRALVPKQSDGHRHHHPVHPHVVMAPPPAAVVIVHAAPPPPPVIVMPRVACQYCSCDIRDPCASERRTRCCFDCSTRRGHC